jgi:hypothetical protein
LQERYRKGIEKEKERGTRKVLKAQGKYVNQSCRKDTGKMREMNRKGQEMNRNGIGKVRESYRQGTGKEAERELRAKYAEKYKSTGQGS